MVRFLHSVFVFYLLSINLGFNFAETSISTGATTPAVLLKLLQEFEDFKKHLSTIDARLKTLQTTLEQRPTSDDSKCTVRDITEAIRDHKFQVAEEKLNVLTDLSKVSNVIHDVYAGSTVNVDIILKFAKSLANADSQLIVFSALRDEMSTNGNSDPFKLIELVECLERVLIRQKNEEFKAKAQILIDNAVEDIKVASTSILKTAMITDKYSKNVAIENLSSALFNFRTDVSNEVMERLVDSFFGVVAADRILDNISSQKHIPQVITGLMAVFNRFNYAGNLNNDATLDLASHLRSLQLRDKYSSISPALKDNVDKLIQQLPDCARNLFFHKSVCLWNKGRGQYLYAASSSISYDEDRRSIYTWYPGDITTGGYWHVERMGKDFFFKNRDHADEYMYSVGIDYNKDMRHVFNWIPGNNTDAQSAWAVELDGDYCYVKGSFYNEYLFAPDVKYDKLNSYVFTWKPGTSVRTAEFQWQIRNCG